MPILDKLLEAMEEIKVLYVKVATLKKVVAHAALVKSQVLEPKVFNGEREMKILRIYSRTSRRTST